MSIGLNNCCTVAESSTPSLRDVDKFAERLADAGILQVFGEQAVVDQRDGGDGISDGLLDLVGCFQVLLHGGQRAVKSRKLVRPLRPFPCVFERIEDVLVILTSLDAGGGDNELRMSCGWNKRHGDARNNDGRFRD